MSIVSYNPLPPLTEGAFLRAGWTPQVINGVVPDLSGLGHDGTLATVKPAFECDPFFGPTLRTYANESGFTFPCTLGVTTVGTWGVWYKLPTLVLPAGTFSVFMQGNSAADFPLGVTLNGTAYAYVGLALGGFARTLVDPGAQPTRANVWTLQVATYDGDKIRLYRDADLRATSPSYAGPINNWNAGTGRIGYYSAVTNSTDGNLRAPFILNRCWSDADVAAYYSSARAACWKSDFGVFVDLADQGGVVGAYL